MAALAGAGEVAPTPASFPPTVLGRQPHTTLQVGRGEEGGARLRCLALELLGAVVETEAAAEWLEVSNQSNPPKKRPPSPHLHVFGPGERDCGV